jgi:uncharacterized delta-60 repeat protein
MKRRLFSTVMIANVCMAFSQSGLPDVTFGDNGRVITNPGRTFNRAISVVVQADGKILTTGSAQDLEDNDFGADFATVKYNSDGTLDQSFGTSGIVITDLNNLSSDVAQDIALQSDGKVLVAGRTHAGTSFTDYSLAVVRYNADGTLDQTFGIGGKAFYPVSSVDDYSYEVSMAIQSDGKILITGTTMTSGHDMYITVRFTMEGLVDTSFGSNGKVVTSLGESFDGYPNAIAIQPDGKILVGGVGVGPLSTGTYADFALVRYLPNGSPDPGFGINGIVLTPVVSGFSAEWVEDLALQSDGKIIAAGSTAEMTIDRMALARYNADGTLDISFGTSGIVLCLAGSSESYIQGVALTTDEAITVAGNTLDQGTGNYDFALLRFLPNGSPDSTFGSGGMVISDLNPDDGYSDVMIGVDGKIVTAGLTGNSGHQDFIVARYLDVTTGSPETPDSFISIYPNPVSDMLSVRLTEHQHIRLRLQDLHGKQLLVSYPGSDLTCLNLTGLPDGVCLLNIEKDRKIMARKRIIRISR